MKIIDGINGVVEHEGKTYHELASVPSERTGNVKGVRSTLIHLDFEFIEVNHEGKTWFLRGAQ